MTTRQTSSGKKSGTERFSDRVTNKTVCRMQKIFATVLFTINQETINLIYNTRDNVINIGKLHYDKDDRNISYEGEVQLPKDLNVTEPLYLREINGKKIIIIAKISEITRRLMSNNGFTFISQSNEKSNSEDIFVVVLWTGIYTDRGVNENSRWSEEFISDIRKNLRKTLVLKDPTQKHHGSIGTYYGLGLVAPYSKKHVSQFASKMGNEHMQKQLKDILESDMNISQNKLQRNMPRYKQSNLAIIKHVAKHGNQKKKKNGNHDNKNRQDKVLELQESTPHEKGWMSGYVCENARTEDFHTEKDASYTSITVPYFAAALENKIDDYKFQFRWGEWADVPSKQNGIDILMSEGTCFAYSGVLIPHRQQLHKKNKDDNSSMWNLSTYHNWRLFNGFRNLD